MYLKYISAVAPAPIPLSCCYDGDSALPLFVFANALPKWYSPVPGGRRKWGGSHGSGAEDH